MDDGPLDSNVVRIHLQYVSTTEPIGRITIMIRPPPMRLLRCHLHVFPQPPTPHLARLPHLYHPSYPIFSKPLSYPTHIRHASTTPPTTADASSLVIRLKNFFLGTTISLALLFGYLYITDVRAGIHQWAVVPSLRWIYDDAEEAHEVGTASLKGLYKWGLHPRERGNVPQNLEVEVFGHTLSNPIGTSAGIDKHAEIPDPLFALGPSIIEIGGATPYPQDGNPKPRVFRLPSQKALINRYGLNSEGADSVAMRLRQRVREYAYAKGFGIDEEAEQSVLDGEAGVPGGSLKNGSLMAVQVAKNKFTSDEDIEAVKADYVYCVEALARYADIIVVNVSSPNQPGLRELQRVEPLTDILTAVVEAAKKAKKRVKPAVMVKVSPDEDGEEQVRGICDAVWESGVDGVIVGNTTKRRHGLLPADYNLPSREAAVLLEQGGYSGPHLFERTVALTRRYRELLDEGMERRPKEPASTTANDAAPQEDPDKDVSSHIQSTIERDVKNLKPDTPEAHAESDSQPLIQIPPRNNPFSSKQPSSTSASSADTHSNPSPPLTQPDHSKKPPTRKVIFATGGIENGKQALEVLEAGASVAQVYTALVYSGVGTIARMKDEMREEMKRRKKRPKDS